MKSNNVKNYNEATLEQDKANNYLFMHTDELLYTDKIKQLLRQRYYV